MTYATTYNPQGTVTLTDGSGLANVVVETGNAATATVVTTEDYANVMHAIEVSIGSCISCPNIFSRLLLPCLRAGLGLEIWALRAQLWFG